MSELTTYTLDGGVATIAMDDGKVNALSIAMLTELHAHLDAAEGEGATVLLTGRAGTLSAGFDLATFGAGTEKLVEMLRLGATLAERILSFPTPVVVAAPGHAIAAGAFALLAADARIGADGPFRIGLNEVRIGLPLPSFAIELARQRLTQPELDRATASAVLYGPGEAAAAGYLDRVVAPDALLDEARATAKELSELNMDAHASTKLRVRAGALAAVRDAIERELTVEAMTRQAQPA